MRFGSFEFRPGLWPTLLTLVLLSLLLGLGNWQLERAVPQWVAPEIETETGEGEEEPAETRPLAAEGDAPSDETGPVDFESLAGSGDDPSRPYIPEGGEDDAPPEIDSEMEETTEAEEDGDEGEAESAPTSPPEPPTEEELLAVDKREFAATAVIRTTLEGAALTSAVFGDRVVLSLPIEDSATREEESPGEPESAAETDEPIDAEPDLEPPPDPIPRPPRTTAPNRRCRGNRLRR